MSLLARTRRGCHLISAYTLVAESDFSKSNHDMTIHLDCEFRTNAPDRTPAAPHNRGSQPSACRRTRQDLQNTTESNFQRSSHLLQICPRFCESGVFVITIPAWRCDPLILAVRHRNR